MSCVWLCPVSCANLPSPPLPSPPPLLSRSRIEEDLQRTVEHIFEEEEELLNLHMNIIQENAELLTEEGRLLQQIQGDDNDIDAYASRLDQILERKQVRVVWGGGVLFVAGFLHLVASGMAFEWCFVSAP